MNGQKRFGVEFITDMARIGMWTGNIVVGLLEDFTALWQKKAKVAEAIAYDPVSLQRKWHPQAHS